jgi:hypothetical protein
VVATEVRSLAGRSAEAAKEIKRLITTSVERVEEGTALVDKAGNTMAEVVSAIQHVSNLMREISGASTEQASGVAQIGEAVASMDQVTQQNAALVEQMAAAASSLNSQTNDLVQVVAVFKLEVGHQAVRFQPTVSRARPMAPQAVKKVAVSPTVKHLPDKPVRQALATPVVAAKVKPSGEDDSWETF